MPISVCDKPLTRTEERYLSGQVECPTCHGTGREEDIEADGYGGATSTRHKCSTCGGTGSVDPEMLCAHCGELMEEVASGIYSCDSCSVYGEDND